MAMCSKCGHSRDRHEQIGGSGRAGAKGEYICLSGKCMCGLTKPKPQGRAKRPRKEFVPTTKPWDEL